MVHEIIQSIIQKNVSMPFCFLKFDLLFYSILQVTLKLSWSLFLLAHATRTLHVGLLPRVSNWFAAESPLSFQTVACSGGISLLL